MKDSIEISMASNLLRKHDCIRFCAAYLCMVLLLISPAAAKPQNPAQPGAARIGLESGAPSLLKAGPLGELMSVFTPRNPDEIQQRLNFAKTDQENAERDVAANRRLVQEAEDRVKISNQEVSTSKTRLDIARKANNPADKATVEVELKRLKAEKNYLGVLLDVAKADATWLDSRKSSSAARVKALELENEITKKYAEMGTAKGDSASSIASYRQSLIQLLEAQEKAADLAKEAASAEKLAADRRVQQLETLSKLKQ
jgi:hypothetical protein